MDRSTEEFFGRHRGKVVGVVLGLLFGLLLVTWGFFKTVFVALCVVLGYLIGKRLDDHFDFRDILNRFFREH
ncbi:MAG TPA: DUF2273 domain-containing protein [Spirochaetia bacterium]|nr:DUF2273 domain-containing protein [Spirochaetia bacterium]